MLDFLGTIIVVLLILNFCSFGPKDDTDPPNGRSGMHIYTDNLTGCQYLGTFMGGLTPRLDKDGKHICTKEK